MIFFPFSLDCRNFFFEIFQPPPQKSNGPPLTRAYNKPGMVLEEVGGGKTASLPRTEWEHGGLLADMKGSDKQWALLCKFLVI
jgi:hypothetical protein